jgi:hypothetical protein
MAVRRFSGSGLLDRTSLDDAELLEAARLGDSVVWGLISAENDTKTIPGVPKILELDVLGFSLGL